MGPYRITYSNGTVGWHDTEMLARTETVVDLYLMQAKRRVEWDDGGEPSSHHLSELKEAE